MILAHPPGTVAAGLLLDLAWWLVADSRLRAAGAGSWARIAVAAFALLQAAWLAEYVLAPGFDAAPPALSALDVANVLWHALLAPLALLGAGAGALVRRLRRRTPTPSP